MDSSPPVIANAQASEAAQPRKRTLRDPAVPAQLLLALDAAARDPRDDVARAALRPAVARVIGFVRIQLRGPLAGAPQGPLAGRHRIQHRRQGERVGVVGRAQAERQRDTLAVVEHVLLRAGTPPVGRIAAGDLAPLFAGTSRLSRLARDQSIRSALPSRSSSVRCKRSQTPASCQSRSRRQQVTPLPQPISGGSSSHGMPLRSTNRIPVSVARSDTRGRPPLGFGGSTGSNGSITSHSSSLTRGLLMPLLLQVPDHHTGF